MDNRRPPPAGQSADSLVDESPHAALRRALALDIGYARSDAGRELLLLAASIQGELDRRQQVLRDSRVPEPKDLIGEIHTAYKCRVAVEQRRLATSGSGSAVREHLRRLGYPPLEEIAGC